VGELVSADAQLAVLGEAGALNMKKLEVGAIVAGRLQADSAGLLRYPNGCLQLVQRAALPAPKMVAAKGK
jgi:hypothetical protein